MKNLIYLFLVCLVIVGCQETTKTSTPPSVAPSPTVADIPKAASSASPKVEVVNEIVLKQEKPLTTHAIQFYTTGLWHYDAALVMNDNEKSKSYQGKWIKLKPDNTIETSYYDGPVKTGNWAIDEAKNILTIVEGGERPTYSEWRIKTSSSSDGIMIWVGTKRFNLNSTQIKMLRFNNPPKKTE